MIKNISFCIMNQGPTRGTIDRSIASILRQPLPGREIIVCGEFPAAHDIKVLRSDGWSETGALNRMRNLLCSNATEEYVVLMTDKFELPDGWYEAIKEADYLDVIGSKIVTDDGIRAMDWAYQIKLGSMKFPYPLAYDEWTTKAYVSGNFMLLRRRAWERIKFDEALVHGDCDDVDFCLRATSAGFRIGVIPQAEVKYNVGNSETTTDVTFGKSRNAVLAFKGALAAGKDALKAGDFRAALVHLKKAAAIVPDDPEALALMGWTYYFAGQYRQAIEALSKAIAVDPASHYAFRGRGWAFLQSGSHENAVDDLIKALDLVKPNRRDDWLETVRGLSWSSYHSGNFDEAMKYFKTLLDEDGHDTGLLQDVYRGLGWCYYRKGMFSEAGDHFKKAISNMNPGNHELAQDAKRGLELIAAAASQRTTVQEGRVPRLPDLSITPRKNSAFPWNITRPRSFVAALRRAARKILSS